MRKLYVLKAFYGYLDDFNGAVLSQRGARLFQSCKAASEARSKFRLPENWRIVLLTPRPKLPHPIVELAVRWRGENYSVEAKYKLMKAIREEVLRRDEHERKK